MRFEGTFQNAHGMPPRGPTTADKIYSFSSHTKSGSFPRLLYTAV